MRIEQSFDLQAPPDRAWPAFKDVELLVACLPGAALTGPPVDGEMPLRFDVRLGPIAASFNGTGRVSFDDAQQSGRFEGSATDRRTSSRVKGAADFALAPTLAGSIVEVCVDYTLTGTLAQFSRGGVVKDLASALTTQFATNLESRISASVSAQSEETMAPARSQESTPATASGEPVAPSPQAAAPLSAGALVIAALKARWRRIVDRWFGRRSA